MCNTTGENTGIKVEEKDGVLVASTDIADGDNRTIVLKYMPDGTIAIDCENDPTLLEKYKEQINAIIEQNRRPLLRPMPDLMEVLASKEFSGAAKLIRKANRYTPCIACGNPAKGGHCFKCQQKKRAA